MKYNKYFDTQHYRECAVCREHSTERLLARELRKAVLISLVVGVADMIVTLLLIKYMKSPYLHFIIQVIIGVLTGWQLGLMWRRMYGRIASKLKHLFFDIQVLTDKIEQMQEEPEEDYELVGDRED